MKIKRYLVKSMPEAYEKIKQDLGKDAIIISSRRVRAEGLKGLLGVKMIEVTAALEKDGKQDRADEHKKIDSLKQELTDVKFMLRKLLSSSEPNPKPINKWKKVLEDLEFNSMVIDELIQGITDSFGEEFPQNENIIQEALTARLAEIFERTDEKPKGRVFAFVGPTGVGKTTTLAKLAAHYIFAQNKKVGLVTIDTYRIGAVEQLKIYGDILNIDVDVVYTAQQLKQVMEKHRDKDVVLIDTAGRSPFNSMRLSELKTFLDAIDNLETYLVLSCTTKSKDLERITAEYQVLNYTQLIFTKVDETHYLGPIANTVHRVKKPVAYITNGQGVPDDIEAAEPYKLAKMILKSGVVNGSGC
ncbi:MAG: flagellar biosynthesis protein FlhF [Clostridia bacterium]|nr:flagellar biosynthesis protein FlhF [Clostridia bacterium]